MLEKNADVNCCFLCSVIFIEYYSTMHCNEVLQACQVDPIYCDIFGAAERVQPVSIYCRYIYKRYIFSGPDILPMPIYRRYVSDIALCSFKRIWGAMEYLTPLAQKSSPKSSCQCNGWLGIGCWILFFGMSCSSRK